MRKFFAISMLIALTGCMHSPRYQYKERRTPVENCKFLKRQATENIDIEDKVVVPILSDDSHYDAAVLSQEVQLKPESKAVQVAQPVNSKPQYVIIKPRDKKTTAAKVAKKGKAEEIKLSSIPPKQTSAAQHKQIIEAKRKEITALNDKSRKLDVTAKSITQPDAVTPPMPQPTISTQPVVPEPSAATPPVSEKPVATTQAASTQPATTQASPAAPLTSEPAPQIQQPTVTQPSTAIPPMQEQQKPPVAPQVTPVPRTPSAPDELMQGDLESSVDAFLNQKNFNSGVSPQQDTVPDLPGGIQRYAPGNKPMPVPAS